MLLRDDKLTMVLNSVGGTDYLFWWFRIRGTVIPSVWWKVLLILVYTLGILCIDEFVYRVAFPHTLIPILGVVVGLLLGFRTNSAYDRYWEGRKIWTQINQDVRKLTRSIWAGVEEPTEKSVGEKRAVLKLVLAFVVATKHHLREEYLDSYDDLKVLIQHLPRWFSTHGYDNPHNGNTSKESTNRRVYKAFATTTPSNLPIEISYYILSYIKHVIRNELAPSWALSTMQGSLSSLVDSFSNFERILSTPIPLAYSIHLHMSVWLYILSLPFQIIGTVGWMALPVMGLGSFCLLGVLCVAYEIENPFGYDDNDLPLDDICHVMGCEMEMITGNKMFEAEEWMYSEWNNPLDASSNTIPNTLTLEKKRSLERGDLRENIDQIVVHASGLSGTVQGAAAGTTQEEQNTQSDNTTSSE